MENYLLIDIYLLTQPLLSVSLVFAYTVLGPEGTAENKTDNDPCPCGASTLVDPASDAEPGWRGMAGSSK